MKPQKKLWMTRIVMMIGNLKEIKNLFGWKSEEEDASIEITGVSTDTRSIAAENLFIALRGENFDGHSFIKKAIDSGAAAVLAEAEFDTMDFDDKKIIKVADTVKAYGQLANFYRKRSGFKVVAITGSSGKTTTKDMVASVLSKKFKVEKTYKNHNNEIGLPFTILNAKPDAEILVLEMGMRARGEIEYLARIAEPDIAIITNIGIAHIGELGSQDNIMHAKGELFENLHSEGIAIINGEDGFLNSLKKKFAGDTRVFGFHDNATIKAVDLKDNKNGTSLEIIRDDITFRTIIKHKGAHMILDCLAAIETGIILGVDLKDAINALNDIEVSPGRLELMDMDEYLIINDTYNANPDSMRKSIDVLLTYDGDKIAVLGDMRELGPEEATYHKEIGKYLADKTLKALVTVGELGRLIGEGLLRTAGSDTKVFSFENNEEAGRKLRQLIDTGDTVLIKGSRAMQMEEIIEILKEDR